MSSNWFILALFEGLEAFTFLPLARMSPFFRFRAWQKPLLLLMRSFQSPFALPLTLSATQRV